jgi:hypothetical protein
MSRPGLFAWASARVSSPPFLGYLFPTMKDCCKPAGVVPRKGPVRRLLAYALYTALAAALILVLWQQFLG